MPRTSIAALLVVAPAAAVLLIATSVLGDDHLEPINVSIQPAVFWGVPFWVAHKEGFFTELGLNVSYEVFASGAPQVKAAVEDKSWDVGGAGCVPNIIGGPQGIQLMAISNDESATSALVGNAAGANNWPPTDPSFPVAITANSTVHYAVLKCLDAEYMNYTDDPFVFQSPSEVIASLTEGTVDYGSLWAPNLYSVLDNVEDSAILCSGDRVGAVVPGGIMVREEFGDEKPELVAKFLAGWIRGIGYIKNPRNSAQSTIYLREFNEETLPGSAISNSAIRQDFALRPMFDLDEQLNLFSREGGKESLVDVWYTGVSDFLVENGVLAENPPVESYITDKYLKMVLANDTLTEFTQKSSSGYIAESDGEFADGDESSTDVPASATLPTLILTRFVVTTASLVTVFFLV